MNFFDGENGHFQSDGKWWIFLAVSIPLTLIVVGSWFGWILYKRRKAEGNGDGNDSNGNRKDVTNGGESDMRGITSASEMVEGGWNR